MERSRYSQFGRQGARNYAISVTANGVESVSPPNGDDLRPQVTATPAITMTGMGDRFRVFDQHQRSGWNQSQRRGPCSAMTTSALSTSTTADDEGRTDFRSLYKNDPDPDRRNLPRTCRRIQSSQESPLTRSGSFAKVSGPAVDSLRRLR